MREDYEFLLALSNDVDDEIRSQIQRLCEQTWTAPPVAPLRNRALPRRPETCRNASR